MRDYIRLKDTKNKIKFILSYNDCEYVRDLYRDYNIDEIERQHNLRSKFTDKDRKYFELIIRNY